VLGGSYEYSENDVESVPPETEDFVQKKKNEKLTTIMEREERNQEEASLPGTDIRHVAEEEQSEGEIFCKEVGI